MKPYPRYRPSGVDWLGDVPEGWGIAPLKASFQIVGGTTPKTDVADYWDGNIPWITPADLSSLPDRFIGSSGRQITEAGLNSCGTTLVDVGSIILSTRAPIGSLAISTVETCTNQGCKALVPRNGTSADYFFYVLLASKDQLNILGRGSTFLELSGDQLGAFRTPLPSLAEQRAIAGFLAREVGKIDDLVAETRRLIALLAEKRQATISAAVTRGLTPDAPLKPSGVEWLGDIPEGWEVRSVSSLFELGRGRVISHEYIHEHAGNYPVYSSQTEKDGEMGRIETFDFEGDYLTWTTDGANAGTVFKRCGKFNCTNVCGTLKPRIALNMDFMRHSLAEATGFFVRHDINPKLMNGVMAKIRLALPPLAEQESISKHIAERTGHFREVQDSCESAIALLLERRAALISAAVTGKIDVRDFHAQDL